MVINSVNITYFHSTFFLLIMASYKRRAAHTSRFRARRKFNPLSRRRTIFRRFRRFKKFFRRSRPKKFDGKGIKIITLTNVFYKSITFQATGTAPAINWTPLALDYDDMVFGVESNFRLANIAKSYQRLKLKKIYYTISNITYANALVGTPNLELNTYGLGMYFYQDKWSNGTPSATEMGELSVKRNIRIGDQSVKYSGSHIVGNGASPLASLPADGSSLRGVLALINDNNSLVETGSSAKHYDLKIVMLPVKQPIAATAQVLVSMELRISTVWSCSKLKTKAQS